MKYFCNILIILSSSLFFCFGQKKSTFDPSNARIGESVEYCHTHKKMKALLNDPAYKQSTELSDQEFQEKLKKPQEYQKGVVYTIPVVFHVLHMNGIENISHDQILDAVALLNRDYRLQNADANNVEASFQGMPSDVEVEFALATKAPNGTCFNGVTRTISPMSYDGSDGSAQVSTIRNNNDVYQGSWKGHKYLNVFVCGEIGGAAGYTTKPSNWSSQSMTNGIWILHDYVGSIGTSSTGRSRTLTHEVGHWLNLDHPWGGNNNPGNASSCSTDDNVDDTPDCIGVTACLLNNNSCSTDNSYWGFDIKDNVENYMDYSYCSKMFTAGQVSRMRAALQVSSTGRSNLWQAANLTSTGADGNLSLCKADFSADQTTICEGESISFTDQSYNSVNGWTWTFTGGSPSTSSSQNPVVTYSQAGLYTVTLTATDGGNSQTETKTQFIRVLPSATTVPYHEGFEAYSSISNLAHWEIYNPNNNNAFELESSFGHSGSKCVRLKNYGEDAGNFDELASGNIDLSVVPSSGSVTLSFRYAYRKKTSSTYEYLKVFISPDCGESWVQRKTLGGSSLSSLTSNNANWAPTSQNDWTTVHMINVTSNYFTSNFRMKFKFESNEGNNFYLDDINLYEGAPSNTIVVGLNENSESFNNVSLFPNPTDSEINISFNMLHSSQMKVELTDLQGKVIQKSIIQANEGGNLVILPVESLSSGSYFAVLNLNGQKSTYKFVVK